MTWDEFATLDCMGSYPTLGITGFYNPQPPPGNVSVTVTDQCKK